VSRKKPARTRHCGTMDIHKMLLVKQPVYRQNRLKIEAYTAAHVLRSARTAALRPIVTIPVVVHIIYRTAAQNLSLKRIQSQITSLNQDFRKRNPDRAKIPSPFAPLAEDTRIKFALAKRDPNGGPTTGVTRTHTTATAFHMITNDVKRTSTGGHGAWPSDSYLNLWVAPRVLDHQGRELLGYAQFPGDPASTDGVVIATGTFGNPGTTAGFNRGRTATHEIGHWLNLLHIWGDDDGGCSGSDNVADTPNQAYDNSGLPTFPHITCNNGPNGDMFMNYMDYTEDTGMFMFTKGQAKRMWAALDGPRASIKTSEALQKPVAVRAVALSMPKRKVSIRKSVGREVGTAVRTIFDGASWVPIAGMRARRKG